MHLLPKFLKLEGTVISSAGQAKPVFDQHHFAGAIAVIHGVDLGNGDVGFVDHQ